MTRTRSGVLIAIITAMIAALMALCLPFAPLYAVADDAAPGGLRLHFGYVGQGDCAIIEFPSGETMIIDGSDYKNENKTLVMAFIQNTMPEGFKYFDYAILTHADADHCGSLDDALNAYPARVVYRPNVKCTASGFTDPGEADLLPYFGSADTAVYKNFIVSAYKANADFTPEVRVIDASDTSKDLKIGEGEDTCDFTFYSPLYAANKKYSSANDYSPIMRLSYRGFSIMMSGDAETPNEREFAGKVASSLTDGVADKYDVFTSAFCADVIKLGHHGSDTSSSTEYLSTVTSAAGAAGAYYVISCGINNKYKHPIPSTLDKLSNLGVPDDHVLRTDILGDIELGIRLDGSEYKLFYGDKSSEAKPPTGLDDVTVEEDKMPDYVKWIIIAVVVIVVIIIIVLIIKGHIKVTVKKSRSSGGKGGKRK